MIRSAQFSQCSAQISEPRVVLPMYTMWLKSSCADFFHPNTDISYAQLPNTTNLYALFLIILETQHLTMLQQPPFSTFPSHFSLRTRQRRLSLISANRLESQSARLSTQSKPRTNQQFHGLGAIKNKQQLGQVGTVGPQQIRKLDGLVHVGQESKVIRKSDFNRPFVLLGLAEPPLQLSF
jgi:hypothetical protein